MRIEAIRREADADLTPREYNYHLLRAALGAYRKNLAQLDGEESAQVQHRAAQSYAIESLVLSTPEAAMVQIEDGQVSSAVGEIASRYPDHAALIADLERNGLDQETLIRSLHRELLFDAVMQRVGARHAAVDELDVHLYYEMHRERFAVPEKRTARHILITINDDYAENTRATARQRIEQIAARLARKPNRFASLARRHSECPSAIDGGKLGALVRGQIYPELDQVLFGLARGEIGPIVESEVGLHILWCERIDAGQQLPLSKVRGQIEQILTERKRRNCQKTWLATLRGDTGHGTGDAECRN